LAWRGHTTPATGTDVQENPLLLFHWEDADLFTFSAEMSGANFPSIYEKREWGFLEEYVNPPG